MTGWYMLRFMPLVPIYIYLPAVLGLLASHGLTVRWSLKRIRDLEGALKVRDVLLGDPPVHVMIARAAARAKPNRFQIVPGETISIQSDDCQVVIESDAAATLIVKAVKFT